MSTPTNPNEYIIIQTPDGYRERFHIEHERIAAAAFIRGFNAALHCFGIYKDGVQVIGCMEEPIKKYQQEMLNQLPALPPHP